MKLTQPIKKSNNLSSFLSMNKDGENILNINLDVFIDNAKYILTHGFFKIDNESLQNANNELYSLLFKLIEKSYTFIQKPILTSKTHELCKKIFEAMEEIKGFVTKDIQAAYDRDPSAYNKVEIILCFPGVEAIIMHRIAHALYKLDIPILPRIISKETHRKTSIDIHPAANIGSDFFIDHGTGVVIGETSIIGNKVTLYHGVTLGTKNFPKNKDNTVIKNLKRHPIIENNVTIYSNSSILGRVTIGRNSLIGANVTIMENIEPFSNIYQHKYQQSSFVDGLGI